MSVAIRQALYTHLTTLIVNPTLPGPALVGSLLLLIASRRNSKGGRLTPAGWYAGPHNAISRETMCSAWKVATGGEQAITATWTVGGGSNDGLIGLVELVSTTGWPVGALALAGSALYDTDGNMPTGAVPAGPLALDVNRTGVLFGWADGNYSWAAWTNAAGWTQDMHNPVYMLIAHKPPGLFPAAVTFAPTWNNIGPGSVMLLALAAKDPAPAFYPRCW